MSETKGPLDEIQWSDADAVAFYKGITAENIHLYFLSSPFCDPTSNNKLLEAQSRFSEAMHPILMSRELFEQRLKTMPGIEYLVVDGPRPGEQTVNPVWVIRKQRRTKVRGGGVGGDKEETLGTYWAVGPNIYQAPRFSDVLSCRLLNISSKLQSIHERAAEMQMFSPSQGYSTLKATPKQSNRPTDSLNTFSRANTPIPGGRPVSPGAESLVGSTAGSTVRDTLNSIAAERSEDDELLRSLQLSIQYQDDYIDLNPLVGEPGSFKFKETQSRAAAKQREMQARKVLLAAAEKDKTSMLSRQGSMAPTTTPGPSEREKELSKEKGKERKGSKTPKMAAKGLKRKGSE